MTKFRSRTKICERTVQTPKNIQPQNLQPPKITKSSPRSNSNSHSKSASTRPQKLRHNSNSFNTLLTAEQNSHNQPSLESSGRRHSTFISSYNGDDRDESEKRVSSRRESVHTNCAFHMSLSRIKQLHSRISDLTQATKHIQTCLSDTTGDLSEIGDELKRMLVMKNASVSFASTPSKLTQASFSNLFTNSSSGIQFTPAQFNQGSNQTSNQNSDLHSSNLNSASYSNLSLSLKSPVPRRKLKTDLTVDSGYGRNTKHRKEVSRSSSLCGRRGFTQLSRNSSVYSNNDNGRSCDYTEDGEEIDLENICL